MTEVIFALGAQEHLVGVTTYCDYPPAAREIPRVGDFSHPSLERIVSLKPDLVVVNLPEQERIKEELERFKIPTFVTAPESLADIYREVADLGRRIGREKAAESLSAYMRDRIRGTGRKPKTVYIELSPRPLITIGRNNFLNEMVELAGGKNVFDDLTRSYPPVSQEAIIKRNPAIIIVLHPEGIGGRIGWEHIVAVRENRVYSDLNPDLLLRPGPRLVLGYRELEKIFE